MTKSFKNLREKMSPEAVVLAEKLAAELRELRLAELRNAKGGPMQLIATFPDGFYHIRQFEDEG